MHRVLLSCSCFLVFSACSTLFQFNQPNTPSTVEAHEPVEKTPLALESSIKKKILVMRFLNHTPYGGQELVDRAFSDILSAVRRCADCIPVKEDELDSTDGFRTDDFYYNTKQIIDKARGSGIAGVILGSIEDISVEENGDEVGVFRTRQYKVEADVKFQMFETASEREIVSRSLNATAIEEHTRFLESKNPEKYDTERGSVAVSKALEKVLLHFNDYAHRINWTGKIAKVDLHRYYINAGEETGLSVGQLLKVVGEGFPVRDIASGVSLGTAPGRFKGLLKIVDFMGKDAAVAVLHSGGGFQEQDRIELYSPP